MAVGRPILVTGLIRSGTTWVGRMIATSPSVGYIHEPLNPWDAHRKSGVCRVPVPCWYLYVTKENEAAYYESIKNMLAFRYSLLRGLGTIRTPKDAWRVWQEVRAFHMHRARGARPLVKEPFAVFSAEWFAETFGMDIVILVRHPAAFVGSIKRVKWGSPFHHLLQQPFLMRDYLGPFEAQLEEYANTKRDIIDQAILTWRIVNYVVIQHRKRHEGWIFLRHEDISWAPVRCFRKLFVRLDLCFSPQVESVVRRYSDPSNPSEVPVEWTCALKRDSRSVIWNWKNRLTESEIKRVREGTSDVAMEFYSDDDW